MGFIKGIGKAGIVGLAAFGAWSGYQAWQEGPKTPWEFSLFNPQVRAVCPGKVIDALNDTYKAARQDASSPQQMATEYSMQLESGFVRGYDANKNGASEFDRVEIRSNGGDIYEQAIFQLSGQGERLEWQYEGHHRAVVVENGIPRVDSKPLPRERGDALCDQVLKELRQGP